MTVRKWTITVHETGQPREVNVFLYDSLAKMRGAGKRHAKALGDPGIEFPEAVGICHGFERIRVNADGTEKSMPLVCVVRLEVNHLTPLIISHEMAHAAQHLYGLDMLSGDELARDHFDAANEDFAHLYGELFNAAWMVLKEAVTYD